MMTEITTKRFSDAMADILANPVRAHQLSLAFLEQISDGEHVVIDATNPFAFLLESSTATASAGLNKTEKYIRQIYPSLATNYDELYHHMSDKDYLERFATPARTTLTLLLGYEEVKQKAVAENDAGVSLLTIPRFTKFLVADVPFTLLYPIEIRVMRHGGFRITYNDDIVSDIETLGTNIVTWSTVSLYNDTWLRIDIPVQQMDISRVYAQINRSTGFSRTYSLTDNFFYCEAYNNINGAWVKMNVTHSELVHDPLMPTVVLNVNDNTVKVSIPQVYINNGRITDSVRIDFYTTRGKFEMNLGGYNSSSFEANWNPIAGERIGKYSLALETFNSLTMVSDKPLTGGSNGIGFEELRRRVINRTTVTEGVPITGKQLSNTLSMQGFNLVTNVDDITDRQFLATRTLPSPSDKSTVSSIGATIQMLISSFSALSQNPLVLNNNNRITLKPDLLYKIVDGILQVVNESERSILFNTVDRQSIVDIINANSYLYSPYYYVIDKAKSTLDSRIYDLSHPYLYSRFFFEQNMSIGVKFDIKEYSVTKATDKDGYYIEIEADLGETLKNIAAQNLDIQLSFTSTDDSNRYYITSEFMSPIGNDNLVIGGRYIWRFHIQTRYDINNNDEMIVLPFYVPINLTHVFDVTTVVKNFIPDTYKPTNLDTIVKNSYLRGGEYIAFTQEKVHVKLGERLERLYNRTRTIVDANSILTRENDEVMRYEKDVYKMDATGTIDISYNHATNQLTAVKLHNAGDIILNERNEPIYKWRKGDIVLDALGKPVYKDGGLGLNREIDIFLFDAKYYFANSATTIAYKEEIIRLINGWVNTEMRMLNGQLLERSEMFYYPTITKGTVKIKADNDKLITVNSQQSIRITFFMSETKYNDAVLRDSIKQSSIKTLHDGLQRQTVSKDLLLSLLRETIGNDIVSVDIEGFLHDNWTTATLLDPAQRLSYNKRLTLKSNGEYDVEDDVTVRFLIHTPY